MTLDTKIKKLIKQRFPKSFEYRPDIRCPVLSTDLMQYFKGGVVPGYIKYQHQLVDYFVHKIFDLLSMTDQLIICVDKESPVVKKIVCHAARKDRRCKLCKEIDFHPKNQTQPRSQFHAECTSKCFEKQILHYEEGPHLPNDNETPILFLDDWMKFALDSRNLRCELYPRIVNALLGCTIPHGKMIFLNGFPLKIRKDTNWTPDSVLAPDGYQMTVQYWEYADLPLRNQPDEIFCHTLKIFDGNRKMFCPEMYNTIPEADNSIFFFLQFFPQHYRQTVFINDGDAISIGLLLAQEYARGVDEQGVKIQKHELILMLPNLTDTFVKDRFEFVNLTTLHTSIWEANEFKMAGVQNPVVTFIFLIILSETDFFQNFCYGIGIKTKWDTDEKKREKQTKGIWDTFYDDLSTFSHLVQFYRGEPSVTEPRRIVIDQDLFRVFIEKCYANKYAKTKKNLDDLDQIRIHCNSKIKDKKRHPPSDEVILRWCRQIDYNINYLINEPRNIHLDPFDTYLGYSYYGYTPDNTIVDIVAAKQKPVDEVYKRHFLKRKHKKRKTDFVSLPEIKKQDVVNKFKGIY
jgi:hypothetical protein